MSRLCLFALLLSALGSSTVAFAGTAATDDETVLAIDAGRLVAMLNQVSVLLKAHDGGMSEPNGEDPESELDFAVSRYNVLLELACGKGIVESRDCVSYAPMLLRPPVPVSALRREVDDAESHVLPLWAAVCTKLDDPARPVCQME